jgi:hypothetical protein
MAADCAWRRRLVMTVALGVASANPVVVDVFHQVAEHILIRGKKVCGI